MSRISAHTSSWSQWARRRRSSSVTMAIVAVQSASAPARATGSRSVPSPTRWRGSPQASTNDSQAIRAGRPPSMTVTATTPARTRLAGEHPAARARLRMCGRRQRYDRQRHESGNGHEYETHGLPPLSFRRPPEAPRRSPSYWRDATRRPLRPRRRAAGLPDRDRALHRARAAGSRRPGAARRRAGAVHRPAADRRVRAARRRRPRGLVPGRLPGALRGVEPRGDHGRAGRPRGARRGRGAGAGRGGDDQAACLRRAAMRAPGAGAAPACGGWAGARRARRGQDRDDRAGAGRAGVGAGCGRGDGG